MNLMSYFHRCLFIYSVSSCIANIDDVTGTNNKKIFHDMYCSNLPPALFDVFRNFDTVKMYKIVKNTSELMPK